MGDPLSNTGYWADSLGQRTLSALKTRSFELVVLHRNQEPGYNSAFFVVFNSQMKRNDFSSYLLSNPAGRSWHLSMWERRLQQPALGNACAANLAKRIPDYPEYMGF